jgi:glutamate-5-semialdehyde dehydrogenase
MSLKSVIIDQARKAREAALKLALLSSKDKNSALKAMASALIKSRAGIIRENARDIKAASQAGLPQAMIDRLLLNEARIGQMADGILDIAALPDPVGQLLEVRKRPNGLRIEKVCVPLGVVAIIYESRPNVTSDCAALCLKSGNAAVLKGGKEAIYSNREIYKVLRSALTDTPVPIEALQFIGSVERAAVCELLKLDQQVDLVVPRGGEGLIRFVAENSTIPVVKHYKGVCHIYVAEKADLSMAADICFNAKVQRPGVCNAMEKMLVDEKIAEKFLPGMIARFQSAGVEIRGDEHVCRMIKGLKKAVARDWQEEYLDLVLAVKVVRGVEEAIDHINTFGSRHSDAIVTRDRRQAEAFLKGVDSACVYVNASTRFTDGNEFGLGAEVGISTDKLHVRGPMGLAGLTTYKYQVYGSGQIRV